MLAWLFVVLVVVDAGTIAGGIAERVMLSRAGQRGFLLESETNFIAVEYGLLAIIGLPFVLAIIVVFIVWFHRVYANLRAIGVEYLRYGTGWAIGCWFVPFLSLWRPKQIINDVWRATDPLLPVRRDAPRREGPVPGLLLAWWILFLFRGVLAEIDLVLSADANTIPELLTSNGVAMVAAAVDGIAAVVALLVVRRVTARQEARAAQFTGLQMPTALSA